MLPRVWRTVASLIRGEGRGILYNGRLEGGGSGGVDVCSMAPTWGGDIVFVRT